MKKTLVILFVVALMAGCASTPMSSVYDGAKPSHVIANGDGSTTFEFTFPYDNNWNADMAMQRMDEYLTGYAKENGFAGYDVLKVDGKLIEKTNTGSAVLVLIAAGAGGYAHNDKPTPEAKRDAFARILVQVKFKT